MSENIDPIHIFRLVFGTSLGNNATISVPLANLNATTEDVLNAMDRMIATGAIGNNMGTIRTRRSARITTHTMRDFELTGDLNM